MRNGAGLVLGAVGALAVGAALSRRTSGSRGSRSLVARGARLTLDVRKRVARVRTSRKGSRSEARDLARGLSEDMRALWSVLNITDPKERAVEYAYAFQGRLRDALEDEGWGDLAEELRESGDAGPVVEQISKRDAGWLENWSEDLERDVMRQEPHELPSFAFFSEPEIRKNAWVVHFTHQGASSIENQGFTRGISDPSLVGLTTHFSQSAKRQPGYVFGFVPEDVSRYGWDGYTPRYGKQVVVFRADAVLAYHWGDEERQAICWGPEARDIRRVYLDGRRPCLAGRHRPPAGLQADYDEYADRTCFKDFPSLVAYLDAANLPSRKGHVEDELLQALQRQGFGSASRKAGRR